MHDYIKEATKNLTEDQLVDFTLKYYKRSKKEHKVYGIFLFTCFIGGHRFYLGNYWQGIVMLFLTIMTFGFCAIIGILDFPNIPKALEKRNKKIALKIIKEVTKV
ncbi:TM2 domain-containing protein [Priestia megaterium]